MIEPFTEVEALLYQLLCSARVSESDCLMLKECCTTGVSCGPWAQSWTRELTDRAVSERVMMCTGQQRKTSSQGASLSPEKSPQLSGDESSGWNKPPQALQQKQLHLQATSKIVKDLESVPPGYPVHGYSLVRGQMLRGGELPDSSQRDFALRVHAGSVSHSHSQHVFTSVEHTEDNTVAELC
jgi:hypothetical protein